MRCLQPTQKSPFKPEQFWKSFPKDLFLWEDSTYISMLLFVVQSWRLSGQVCLDAFGRTTRKPSTVRALFLAYSIETAMESGSGSFAPGKLTLFACATVEQREVSQLSPYMFFMRKDIGTFHSKLSSCFFLIWGVFIWLILEDTEELFCFHVLKAEFSTEALRAPGLSRNENEEEFLAQGQESAWICWQRAALYLPWLSLLLAPSPLWQFRRRKWQILPSLRFRS